MALFDTKYVNGLYKVEGPNVNSPYARFINIHSIFIETTMALSFLVSWYLFPLICWLIFR